MGNPPAVRTLGVPVPGVAAVAWHAGSEPFRWMLCWRWAPGSVMVFIGLNPSTADAFTADHTARRSADFARREGCGAMAWVNLMPRITPYPAVLRAWAAGTPQAEMPWWREPNDRFILRAVTQPSAAVVCAWGANAASRLIAPHRAHAELILDRAGVTRHALGVTRSGCPAHPLRLRRDAPLRVYP